MMGRAKPTLGYPSRTAAVLALRADGLPLSVIAQRIGITPQAVGALECSAKRHACRPKPATRLPSNTVAFSYDLREHLRTHARKRETTVEMLALRILEAVAYGDLVDAVLDDRDEVAS